MRAHVFHAMSFVCSLLNILMKCNLELENIQATKRGRFESKQSSDADANDASSDSDFDSDSSDDDSYMFIGAAMRAKVAQKKNANGGAVSVPASAPKEAAAAGAKKPATDDTDAAPKASPASENEDVAPQWEEADEPERDAKKPAEFVFEDEADGEISVPGLDPTISLFQHQREGVQWMYDRETGDGRAAGKLRFNNDLRMGKHGMLCDDMGLGKTMQTICLILKVCPSAQ